MLKTKYIKMVIFTIFFFTFGHGRPSKSLHFQIFNFLFWKKIASKKKAAT
jgi:hypothetical protein